MPKRRSRCLCGGQRVQAAWCRRCSCPRHHCLAVASSCDRVNTLYLWAVRPSSTTASVSMKIQSRSRCAAGVWPPGMKAVRSRSDTVGRLGFSEDSAAKPWIHWVAVDIAAVVPANACAAHRRTAPDIWSKAQLDAAQSGSDAANASGKHWCGHPSLAMSQGQSKPGPGSALRPADTCS